jgi:hypothetical protein
MVPQQYFIDDYKTSIKLPHNILPGTLRLPTNFYNHVFWNCFTNNAVMLFALPTQFSLVFNVTKFHFPASQKLTCLAFYSMMICMRRLFPVIYIPSGALGLGSVAITWALLGSGPSKRRHMRGPLPPKTLSHRIKRGRIFASEKPLAATPWERKLMLRDEEREKESNKTRSKKECAKASICSFWQILFPISFLSWQRVCNQSEIGIAPASTQKTLGFVLCGWWDAGWHFH